MNRKVKVAIVGCGQIAEAHLREISLIAQAQTVAVCDLIGPLAKDMAERFGIGAAYTDHKEMLREMRPDVVHVTTPPHTHLQIGQDILRNGSHAYIEKPFGMSLAEAEQLIIEAEENRVTVCAGFSQLYDRVSLKLRTFMDQGKLGDVVHVESYYGDSLEGNFSKLFLRDKQHWIHRLPGKLFHNIISHPLYQIVPLFSEPVDRVSCLAFDRTRNGVFQDELRVVLQSRDVTAFMTYTTGVRPIAQFCRIYGTKAIAEMDLTNHVFTYTDTKDLPGPLARIRNAVVPGLRLVREGIRNTQNFITGRDRFFAGMGSLFCSYYRNIAKGLHRPPVPYPLVRQVAWIIDEVAAQCRGDVNGHGGDIV